MLMSMVFVNVIPVCHMLLVLVVLKNAWIVMYSSKLYRDVYYVLFIWVIVKHAIIPLFA
jgi:hypothetical protein